MDVFHDTKNSINCPQYDPVTMVVLGTAHQVGCILWEQVAFEYIFWRILTTMSMFDVANILKNTFNDVSINNNELLNIQACSFLMF